MGKVIAFVSRKGGTGKTTTAINLATMLFNLGHKVSLVETDTNYTLNTLRQMELFKTGANDKSVFQIIASDDRNVINQIDTLKADKKLDFIIIDSAGKHTDENIKKLSMVCDMVVVPTSLTQNDLLVTFQTVEDLKPARVLNPNLKIVVLPNRVHSSTKKETIQALLEQLDAIVTESRVPQKNTFANFSTLLPEKEFLEVSKELISLL
ncbi:ParA family protein [Cytophagales bacterium LB-30]|uniref:ParA family protein n=1 Tax=Shiella aurantiaca TaxID=3058365 RepID=A0ABT8F205_9BACT|nr:ParA family protein [Shiella aurantiaca]MDN4164482.1 ParA family protein [Shiella aurantiaca]